MKHEAYRVKLFLKSSAQKTPLEYLLPFTLKHKKHIKCRSKFYENIIEIPLFTQEM